MKWVNIKELHTEKNFAVLTAKEKLTRADAIALVPQGKVTADSKQITVASGSGEKVVPIKEADRLIDAAEFEKTVNSPPALYQGFGGTASAGASLVRQTENSTTFNGSVSLVRAVPLVDWLPAKDRTTFDYTQSYESTSQPLTDTVKTNIFHSRLEQDRYFKPRGYGFGSATFDHNSSQFLSLQQAYGAGVGISLLKDLVKKFDVRADIHYEKQTFLPATTPNENLIGSTFSDTLVYILHKGVTLNEFASFSPSWNVLNAYSAHVNGSLTFAVYKNFGFNVGAVDDYLNNAPLGTQKNSTQFTTGLTYTLTPR